MTQAPDTQDWAARLQNKLDNEIPITRAMGLKVLSLDDSGLVIIAPLDANVNDKGTAFGGSISALLTLAGWGLIYSGCQQRDLDCDIVIHKGEIRFRRPVTGPLHTVCPGPDEQQWQTFIKGLNRSGKARMALTPHVLDTEGQRAVRFDCEYVAITKR